MQVKERIQEQIVPERIEEQVGDIPVPPILEKKVEVVQIIPDSLVPHTVEGCSEVMRLQELLLGSVAALDRIQVSAASLDQRIVEHESRI